MQCSMQQLKTVLACTRMLTASCRPWQLICDVVISGWLDYDKAMMEALIAFKRAGADAILTYAAPWAAKALLAKGQALEGPRLAAK